METHNKKAQNSQRLSNKELAIALENIIIPEKRHHRTLMSVPAFTVGAVISFLIFSPSQDYQDIQLSLANLEEKQRVVEVDRKKLIQEIKDNATNIATYADYSIATRQIQSERTPILVTAAEKLLGEKYVSRPL